MSIFTFYTYVVRLLDESYIKNAIQDKLYLTSLASKLGFFSKPIEVHHQGKNYILKVYKPQKNKDFIQWLINEHDKYVVELTQCGITIPETTIQSIQIHRHFHLSIVQNAFHKNELIRTIFENESIAEICNLLAKILDESILFWEKKSQLKVIGFHPTLRNYAYQNNQLYYFDTFPPMSMSQKEINSLILKMTPLKINISFLIPNSWINRVSNEYYQKDKMLIGLIGSTCRLRPELKNEVLSFAKNYFLNHPDLTSEEKGNIISLLEAPPKLSFLWTSIRKLLGKTGKPNV